MRPLVIYHGQCYDGLTAAWVASKALDDPEFYPAIYGVTPEPTVPLLLDREVYILDFSYPRKTMEGINIAASKLVVLDHHKTAEAECRGLKFCTFDMNRSGCRLAWDYWFAGSNPPRWLLNVEDRDLWRMALPDTPFVHAAIASRPMNLTEWEGIDFMPHEDLVAEGRAIRRYIDTWIEKAAHEARFIEFPDGVPMVALNVPYQNASEVGSYLLDKYPEASYAMGYFRRHDGRWQYSLRSRGNFDVSTLAKYYGGGGHAGASGFDSEELLV